MPLIEKRQVRLKCPSTLFKVPQAMLADAAPFSASGIAAKSSIGMDCSRVVISHSSCLRTSPGWSSLSSSMFVMDGHLRWHRPVGKRGTVSKDAHRTSARDAAHDQPCSPGRIGEGTG
jgi:hypothetical protein